MPNHDYDVIILGAGPAGLSVGSQLAATRRLKVLVVDRKENLGDTTRSWFVPRFFLDAAEPDVLPFTYGDLGRLIMHTATSNPRHPDVPDAVWPTTLERGYRFIREHALLEHWGTKINREAGCEVKLKCRYVDHDADANGVTLLTSAGSFTARVLIDAAGHDSPVRRRYEHREDLYWWSVYGCIAKHPGGLHGMRVGDYLLWGTFKDLVVNLERSLRQGQAVFEYEILDDQTSFPMVLFLRREKVPVAEMKPIFEHIMSRESLTQATFHDMVPQQTKFGWYPSGGIDQGFSQDRIDFIGDAGIWSTPCGWGMGFILQHYVGYARRLVRALDRDDLSAPTLRRLIKVSDKQKRHLLVNRVATRFLANGRAPQLDKFVELFDDPAMTKWGHPGAYFCEKLFTLSASGRDYRHLLKHALKHFDLDEIIGVFPPDERRGFAKELADLVAPCLSVRGVIDATGLDDVIDDIPIFGDYLEHLLDLDEDQ